MENKQKDEPFYGLAVMGIGIIVFFLGILMFGADGDTERVDKKKAEYVYYDVPIYTTVYEIVYPDSVYRYIAVHHSPSELSSWKGTNELYSATHSKSWADDYPEYWQDAWNKDELNVKTTAPIRIVSETVEYKKMKFKMEKR